MTDPALPTEAELEALIPAFYARVRGDALIGPVFERAIADWDHHLAKLVAFWSSVMLTSGRYKGNPVAVHHRVEGIEIELFDRWLALFDETCRDLFTPAIAAEFMIKAVRIAESLKLALFYRPDRPWPPDLLKGAP